MSKIYFLPVKHGDAFIIECVRGDTQGLVVVDGGPRSCGFELKRKLNELGTPDLMVLTHYDEDHIGGILQLVDTCLDDNRGQFGPDFPHKAGQVVNRRRGRSMTVFIL